MASLEEILAYKAAERAEMEPGVTTAGTILGATGGSLLGMMAGIPVHKAGNAVNAIKGSLAARQVLLLLVILWKHLSLATEWQVA